MTNAVANPAIAAMRFRPFLDRRGFTLVELLVVIAMIGVLVALLLPAVQAARESARRAKCQNNLRQAALALHMYYDNHQHFPAGYILGGRSGDVSNYSWSAMILSYLEQPAIVNGLAPNNPQTLREALSDSNKVVLMQQKVAAYRCPSVTMADRNPDRTLVNRQGVRVEVASANYVGNHGVLNRCPEARGVFCAGSKVRLPEITDGTSNTFLLGERTNRNLRGTGKHGAAIWVGGTSTLGNTFPDDSPVGFLAAARYEMQTGRIADAPASTAPIFCYSSEHGPGSLFAMCDASVRYVSETIDSRIGSLANAATWGIFQKLADRDDGETVGAF
jgi:prepilin-type N-terminal cleavage/methylation domain-containing protein